MKGALEIAHGIETAAKDVRDLRGEMPNKLNKLHGGEHKDENKVKDCYRCGGKHDPTKCRFGTETCYKCGKIGHMVKVCRSSKKISSNKEQESQGRSFRRRRGRGLQVNKVEQSHSDEELEYSLFKFKEENKTQSSRENFTVNDVDINIEIDREHRFR